MLMRTKRSLDRLPAPKASGVHDLMGSVADRPVKNCLWRWDVRRAVQSRAFYSFVTACRAFKVRVGIPHDDAMITVITWRVCSLTAASVSN